MIIWRSVGVQALADALSLWAHRQAHKADVPPRAAAAADPAAPADAERGARTPPGGEPKIVYNADRRS
jgi:hypothetical protein